MRWVPTGPWQVRDELVSTGGEHAIDWSSPVRVRAQCIAPLRVQAGSPDTLRPYIYRSRTTGFRRTPISLISTSTMSPSFMFSPAPSVPIQRTSPGCRVRYRLIALM